MKKFESDYTLFPEGIKTPKLYAIFESNGQSAFKHNFEKVIMQILVSGEVAARFSFWVCSYFASILFTFPTNFRMYLSTGI